MIWVIINNFFTLFDLYSNFCRCVLIGCYDARVRVLAKYLNLYLSSSFDKFEEIEDIIVNSFANECHELTE